MLKGHACLVYLSLVLFSKKFNKLDDSRLSYITGDWVVLWLMLRKLKKDNQWLFVSMSYSDE